MAGWIFLIHWRMALTPGGPSICMGLTYVWLTLPPRSHPRRLQLRPEEFPCPSPDAGPGHLVLSSQSPETAGTVAQGLRLLATADFPEEEGGAWCEGLFKVTPLSQNPGHWALAVWGALGCFS